MFVADGYCNSRVVLFSPAGKYLMQQNAAVNNLGKYNKLINALVSCWFMLRYSCGPQSCHSG